MSKKLRAAFCKLILTIHIDTFPREEFVKPELIKVLQPKSASGDLLRINTRFRSKKVDFLESIDSLKSKQKKKIVKSLINLPGNSVSPLTEDMIDLEAEDKLIKSLSMQIIEYFNDQESTPCYDILTLEMLRLSDKMVKFEIYGSSCSDWQSGYSISDPSSPWFKTKQMDIIKFLVAVKPMFFNEAIRQGEKDRIKNRRGSRFSKMDSEDSKSKVLLKSSFLSSLLNDPSSLNDPVIRGASNLRNFLHALQQNNILNPDLKTFEHRIKIKICRILHYYMDTRQEFLICNISSWFSTQSDIKTDLYDKLKRLLPNVMKIGNLKGKDMLVAFLSDIHVKRFKNFHKPEIPDLNVISDKPILSQLLKAFVNSNHYKLQSLILRLIIRCFKQRHEMLQSVKRLYAVSNKEDMNLLRWLRENVNKFRQNSEQSELWLNYWKHSDSAGLKYSQKFEEVMNFLEDLGNLFYEDTFVEFENPVLGEQKTISKSRQDIIFYLGVHEHIISLIKDGMHTLSSMFENPDFIISEARENVKKLFTSCHKILRRFVFKHPKNQKRLHKHVHVFLQHLRLDVDQIPLLCEIFKDNHALIAKINKDIFKKFKRLIYLEGRQPEFLDFFEVIQIIKGKPIPMMQRSIINLFVKEDFNRFLLYMDDEQEPNFTFKPEDNVSSSWTYKDKPFDYHAKLFNVLSKCAFGVSGMYMNEAKIQKMVRLPKLFELLKLGEDKSSPYNRLRIPILELFFNIYLDCESPNEETRTSGDFVNYVMQQSHQIDLTEEFDASYIYFLQI